MCLPWTKSVHVDLVLRIIQSELLRQVQHPTFTSTVCACAVRKRDGAEHGRDVDNGAAAR